MNQINFNRTPEESKVSSSTDKQSSNPDENFYRWQFPICQEFILPPTAKIFNFRSSDTRLTVLNGKIFIGEEIPNDPALRQAFKAAKIAMTQIMNIRSTNYLSRDGRYSKKPLEEILKEDEELDKLIIKMTDEIARFENKNIDDFVKSSEIIEKYGLGQCDELCSLAIAKIYRDFPEIEVELFKIKNGDHCYLRVGNDPLKSVIADLWARTLAPASFIPLAYSGCVIFEQPDIGIMHVPIVTPRTEQQQPKSKFKYTPCPKS